LTCLGSGVTSSTRFPVTVSTLRQPPRPRIDPDEAFRLLVLGTVSSTGEAFFRSLVHNLTKALRVAGAWVTEYDPATDQLHSLAFCKHDQFVESFSYPVAGTACEVVIRERRFMMVEDRVFERFGRDSDLRDWGVVSYLGVPLLAEDGSVLGHLGAIDTRPIEPDPALEPVFTAFAARGTAELLRLRAEKELRAREEQFSRLFDTAMDAMVITDAECVVQRANLAALRVFGCTEEDLVGERICEFFGSSSAQQLELFLTRLKDPATPDDGFWVPQAITGQRWDRTPFPAEVTVSRFRSSGAVYFTIIVRSLDERVAAERRIRELAAEADYLRDAAREVLGPGEIMGVSPGMRAVFDAIERVAPSDSSVLVRGETGTGKELVARAVHQNSRRASGPLVRVNCAAIPAALMESEFFGHEKGAFTGATARRDGRFALANDGTLFLDEIGELPLDLQAKLLRVLQEGEFERVGGTTTIKVDVRIIAATNRDLATMVREGRFREDLYYRLAVFPIELPPLRARGKDIALLAQAFLDRFAARMGRSFAPLDADDIARLHGYPWPGNVRELQNVVERAIILARGARIELSHAMPGEGAPRREGVLPSSSDPSATVAPRVLSAAELRGLEKDNLRRALAASDGKISGPDGAAAKLGLPPTTVASRVKALGLGRSAS
jgi:PAS domain S-box-containing protein